MSEREGKQKSAYTNHSWRLVRALAALELLPDMGTERNNGLLHTSGCAQSPQKPQGSSMPA